VWCERGLRNDVVGMNLDGQCLGWPVDVLSTEVSLSRVCLAGVLEAIVGDWSWEKEGFR
jgi:hypothetical protein